MSLCKNLQWCLINHVIIKRAYRPLTRDYANGLKMNVSKRELKSGQLMAVKCKIGALPNTRRERQTAVGRKAEVTHTELPFAMTPPV